MQRPARPIAVLAGALLATCLSQFARSQEAESANTDIGRLCAQTKVKLGKALTLALKARPGIATAVELETTKVGDDEVPCFEVMIRGDDHAVYEVRVHAQSGKVLANAVCTDEEDAGEVTDAVAKQPAVTLASVVAEAQALLRGTCVTAQLVAKTGRAEVALWNRGREVHAGFALGNGALADVTCRRSGPAPKADEDDDEHGEKDDEHGEKDEHEEHGRRAHGEKKDDDEEEDDD